MSRLKTLYLNTSLITFVCLFYSSKADTKSSLAFAIDNTYSMTEDIETVKRCANDIYNTVINSNASQIQNFVLVTFNDPDVLHRVTTRDRNEFLDALSNVYVTPPNMDCPEMSMTGTELAIKESLPGSLLYVFTDAKAKDKEKHEVVKNLALQKQIQLTFIITPNCYDHEEVYYQLARETDGIVFNIKSSEVSNLLEYVKTQINSRKVTLVTKNLPSGTHKVELEVDSKMKELVVTVSGSNLNVEITDPDGGKPPAQSVVDLDTAIVVKVTEVKPGTYTAEVTSSTEASIKVTAESSLHFEYGFSSYPATSIQDTAKRPIPDEPTYLAIKLPTEGTENFVLDTVKIMEMDNNVIAEQPLHLVHDKDNFYVTKTTIVPPNKLFRVAITGHDLITDERITRISLTPVEPQKRDPTVEIKKPTVSVVGHEKVNAEYDEPLLLKCKISGNPKPKVVWQRSDGTLITTNTKLHLVELPGDYLSTLYINKITSNETYYCVARNDHGGDVKQISVETIRKTYFNVLKKPKSATIELNNKAEFECDVNAYPIPKINWYLNGDEISNDGNVEISKERSKLLIKHMQPYNVGKYVCDVINEITGRRFHFRVDISGVESPIIDKAVREIRVQEGSNVEIPCKLIKGKPKPTIFWHYKDLQGEEYALDSSRNAESVFLENVSHDSVGYRNYQCEAQNDIGTDFYNVELIVEYPPIISDKEETNIISREGDKLQMRCDVEGEPYPVVKWYLNGEELPMTAHHRRGYYTNGFNFYPAVKLEDSGIYTCEAANKYGSAIKTIHLRVVNPPTIETPSTYIHTVKVGRNLDLRCVAEGYPKPKVTWVFNSLDPKRKPRIISTHNPRHLSLRRMQIADNGFYTCIASNFAGSYNITYDVRVQAPPIIQSVTDKRFTAVVGDLTLRVPCKASGNPKPVITWKENGGFKVATGTKWYDIEEDGTLVIKNIDKESAGEYLCEARNTLGVDNELYDVFVEAYPRPGNPTKRVMIERGKSGTLNCDIHDKKLERTDIVRWFKDGKQISTSLEYVITNAEFSAGGVYTCRVSDFYKSRSGNVYVEIGFKPIFTSEEEKSIEFEEGSTAFMDCSADGYPTPKVTWWHNGNVLPVVKKEYNIEMDISKRGKYICEVQNEFGRIHREFDIMSEECLLNIQSELRGNQPLILSSSALWPAMESINGYLKIPLGEKIVLSCPNGFQNFHRTEIETSCKRDAFIVYGRVHKFADLHCRGPVTPTVKESRKLCLKTNSNSQTLSVGYRVRGRFLKVYDVCFDTNTKTPIYALQGIHYTLSNVEPRESEWLHRNMVSRNIDDLYDCKVQIEAISSILASQFHAYDKCCFAKRFLVNPSTVSPGLHQAATYSAINLVPHWSTCKSDNWESVERRVRLLAKSTNERLLVWTGAAKKLEIAGHDIRISDKDGKAQPVSKYMWKVIQNPTTKASLAIIQLNIPDLTTNEAYRHMFCRDICQEVAWMKSQHWHDVTRGFTFCCHVHEFERALGYQGVFYASNKVLYDVSLVSGHSLV